MIPAGRPGYNRSPTIVTRNPLVLKISDTLLLLNPIRSGITNDLARSPRLTRIETAEPFDVGGGICATTVSV